MEDKIRITEGVINLPSIKIHDAIGGKTLTYICPECNSKALTIKFTDTTDVSYIKRIKSYVNFMLTWKILVYPMSPHFYNSPGKCPCCGKKVEFYSVDYDIADIIIKLNKLGIKTKYCCSGHFKNAITYYPYVAFADDYSKYFQDGGDLFKWYYDMSDPNMHCLRVNRHKLSKEDIENKTYLFDLEKYIDEVLSKEVRCG